MLKNFSNCNSCGGFHGRGFEEVEDRGGDFKEEAAAAGVDVNFREVEEGFFDVDWHGLFESERGCAADLVTGVAFGRGKVARGDTFDVEDAGELFEGDFAVAVHEHDERLFIRGFEHKGFDDVVLGDAERFGGDARAAVFEVGVFEEFEEGIGGAELADGGGNHENREGSTGKIEQGSFF